MIHYQRLVSTYPIFRDFEQKARGAPPESDTWGGFKQHYAEWMPTWLPRLMTSVDPSGASSKLLGSGGLGEIFSLFFILARFIRSGKPAFAIKAKHAPRLEMQGAANIEVAEFQLPFSVGYVEFPDGQFPFIWDAGDRLIHEPTVIGCYVFDQRPNKQEITLRFARDPQAPHNRVMLGFHTGETLYLPGGGRVYWDDARASSLQHSTPALDVLERTLGTAGRDGFLDALALYTDRTMRFVIHALNAEAQRQHPGME